MSTSHTAGMTVMAAAAAGLCWLAVRYTRRAARRGEVPAHVVACGFLVPVLLLLGGAAALGPSAWVPAGVLMMLAAAVPLVLLVSAPVRAKRRRAAAERPRPYRVPPARDGSAAGSRAGAKPSSSARASSTRAGAKPSSSTRAGATPADRIYEAATRQHKQRPRPYRLTVSSPQVRVAADPDGLTVEHSVNGTWRSHLTLPWRDISGLVFDHDHRDPVVSLYVIPAQGTRRHAMDSSHLPAADWTRLADAVAANTDGRIRLDLAARDGHHVNPDA